MFASKILQVHRDRVKPGCERIYTIAEQEAARICAERGCPHPHLAIESLSAPMEVWWLNGFESEEHRQRIVDAYQGNVPLMEGLAHIRTRREGLLDLDIDVFVHYKPELSQGPRTVAAARFIAVTVTTQDHLPPGAVFESADGTRYVFMPTASAEQASAASAGSNANAVVFAVRPYWGMPAREWIAADADFWRPSPVASLR